MIDWSERINCGARLEPVDGVLHGAGQSPDALREYTQAVGPAYEPAVFMTYMSVKKLQPGALQRRLDECNGIVRSGDAVVQIGLSMTSDGSPELRYEHEVADGLHDEALRCFCRQLAEYGKPVFLRIGYEFNGHWNGYQPEPFVAAWRRICKMMDEYELDNVARVWCYAPDGADNPWMPYYPGDELVDWWSIDLFSASHMTMPETAAFIAEALEHRKPVMIGESTPRYCGVNGGDASWNEWYKPYFELIRSSANMKAFCYINWDWSGYPKWHDWGDGRIQENRQVLESYRREMACSQYLHANSGWLKNV